MIYSQNCSLGKCPSYGGVRLTVFRLIKDLTYVLPGHVKVFVLERCPSYGMSVLRYFTVFVKVYTGEIF